MTEALKRKISESIYEIFVNAQMHSKSEYIYTCGQFYPKKQKIAFTIVDMGQGFKANINNRFRHNLSSIQAIKWATENGSTTKTDAPGGIGLAILKEFITMNIYNTASGDNLMAQGQARAVILFFILVVISLIQTSITKRKEIDL